MISILATYHIQKRRGQALLFSLEYDLSPEFDIKVKVTTWIYRVRIYVTYKYQVHKSLEINGCTNILSIKHKSVFCIVGTLFDTDLEIPYLWIFLLMFLIFPLQPAFDTNP